MDVPSSIRFELGDTSDPAAAALRIEAIEKEAVRIGRAGGLSVESAHFLGVALNEAIVNALRHGRGPDGRCAVVVRLRTAFDRVLSMMVRDRGPGFDPAQVADPSLPENQGKSNGRGIFFMRRFSDRVHFVFPADGGVVVRLAKRLPGRPRVHARSARRTR